VGDRRTGAALVNRFLAGAPFLFIFPPLTILHLFFSSHLPLYALSDSPCSPSFECAPGLSFLGDRIPFHVGRRRFLLATVNYPSAFFQI